MKITCDLYAITRAFVKDDSFKHDLDDSYVLPPYLRIICKCGRESNHEIDFEYFTPISWECKCKRNSTIYFDP